MRGFRAMECSTFLCVLCGFAALREALFGAWQVFYDEWTPAVFLCLTQRREGRKGRKGGIEDY
jgi:hypothetical protein